MEEDKGVRLGILSTYRSVIYGMAICSIVVFHYFQVLMKTDSIFAPIAKIYEVYLGSVGVDIFIILSGIGMYYSLYNSFKKNSFNLVSFYVKRIKRLFVPYVLAAIIFWYIIDIVIENKGVVQYFKDISFCSFISNGERSIWYIFAIGILYMFSPLIYILFDKLDRVRGLLCAVMIVAVCVVNWLLFDYQYDLYCNIEIMLTRIPAFIFGMYIGKNVNYNIRINKLHKLGVVLFICVDLVISSMYLCDSPYDFLMLRRYTQILRAIVLLTIMIYVINKYADRMNTIFLKKCGELSLEIYLVHVCIFEIMKAIDIRFEEIFMFFVYVGLTSVLVNSLHKWSDIITNKLFRNG